MVDDRKAFEEIRGNQWRQEDRALYLARHLNGAYVNQSIQAQWEIWQAALIYCRRRLQSGG
jgi:hypothetical protein